MFEVEVSYIQHNTLQVPCPQLEHSVLYVGCVFRLDHLFVCVKCLLLTLFCRAHHHLSLPVYTSLTPLSLYCSQIIFQHIVVLQLSFKSVESAGGHLSRTSLPIQQHPLCQLSRIIIQSPIKMVVDGRLAV